MPSWEKLRYERLEGGSSSSPSITPVTDQQLSMSDKAASVSWMPLLSIDTNRHGFLVQNASQNEIRIRAMGETSTGTRLPNYGDSFSPDFKPERAYEIQAAQNNSAYLLAVW